MNPPRARSVIIHGHFYQPPRDDPWLEEIPMQESAAPFHDWNERIEHECYRAVVAARLTDADGRITGVVNTLTSMSFNFGPTLLEWMERKAKRTYAAILDADRESQSRLGHGNAIAMPYHHPILPLCSRRDKQTEVRWGIWDFRRRFHRDPVGMWLPETAVDDETLDVLAEEGIAFTILAPHQVKTLPAKGLPGRYHTKSGKTIALFLYDGGISHDIAFGPLLRSAETWYDRVMHPRVQLVSMAVDGETFGHHHKFGDMALAAFLHKVATHKPALENFASFLDRHPPEEDVTLVAPSSWSCAHGVERWRANCGCRISPDDATQQEWRKPLREALEWLANELHTIFERNAAELVEDPWTARDHYVDTLAVESDTAFVKLGEQYNGLPPDRIARLGELLELERNALRMFTSCGWFFDDVARIETVQVLRYADRAIALAGDDARRLMDGLIERLTAAKSNDSQVGTGADVLRNRVMPTHPAFASVAAGYAIARTLGMAEGTCGAYSVVENGEALTVQHHRTGASHDCTVSVARESVGRFTVTVTSTNSAPILIALNDIPDGLMGTIRGKLRQEIADRRLTADDKSGLLAGQPFAMVVKNALVRSVSALQQNPSDEAIAEAEELLDLCELSDTTIPFHAQTTVAAILENRAQNVSTRLRSLACRMNFAPRDA